MPFDSDIGIDTDPARQPRLTMESDGSEFVPDIHHVADDIVLLADGSLLAMIRHPGFPFELETMNARNIRRRQINDLIRGIADDNVALTFHLARHNHAPSRRLGRFHSNFARRVIRDYERNLSDLMAVEWFITVVVAPRFSPGRRIRRQLARFGFPAPAEAGETVVRQMKGVMQALTSYFGQTGGERLGYRKAAEGHRCSEIAEARKLFITGRWQSVPLTTGTLGAAIYTDRVTCGTRAVRIDGLDGPRFAKTLAVRDYPGDETRTGQFSHLALLTDPFVLSQSFRFQGREAASTRIYLKLTRMANAFDSQKRGMEKLEDVREEVVAGETVRGFHAFNMTLFGPDLEAVHLATSAAGTAINQGAAVPIAEDGGSFAAFWSMLPGNPDWLEGRSGSISSKNLTAMASLEGYPRGQTTGYWGPAIIRFATRAGTAFDFVPHVEDVGHALFIGRSRSGKTLLMSLLACALEQVMAEHDRLFWLDKDQAAEPMIRAVGGVYLTLKYGTASGMAPLRGLTDTPANRAFLEHWIATLMTSDERGPLHEHTIKMLHRAVARQMQFPPEERSLGNVRQFLGHGEGTDEARMDRWCQGGPDGWLFDNEADEVRTDARFVGFDLTSLFDHPACPHVAAYLLQRIRELIDGRRVTVVCDEVRFYLLTPIFADAVRDFSLTLRKRNGMLWLAGQEIAHMLNSAIGTDLVNQAATQWLFAAGDTNEAEYARIGCTPAMYRAITQTMPTLPYRSVLLKRDNGSAILRTDLGDLPGEISVLSGREQTVRLIPAIRAITGDDPDAFTAEFIRQCAAQRQKEATR